jgi:hypothetical protein
VKRLGELPTGYPEVNDDLSSGLVMNGIYFTEISFVKTSLLATSDAFLLKLKFYMVFRMLCGGVETGSAWIRSYFCRKLLFESSYLYEDLFGCSVNR